MKKLTFIMVALMATMAAFAQVQLDKPLQLTGTGADAKIEGIKNVTNDNDAANKKYVDDAVNAKDGSETKITAGTNITVTGSGTIASPYVINASGGATCNYTIGLNNDLGGYVFYVTPNGCHGLVAATQDQSASTRWGTAQNQISNAANHNTVGKNFTDWRVPTFHELQLVWASRNDIGGFSSGVYWSITENFTSNGWMVNWSDGQINATNGADKTANGRVRAVRSF